MNNGLSFSDWFLLWLCLMVFSFALAYMSGLMSPSDMQELTSFVHSIPDHYNQVAHDAHVARQALGQSVADWNYVASGHPIIPPPGQ